MANIMKRIMTAAKIPADFLPHSTRAAGMAQGKTKGMSDDDAFRKGAVTEQYAFNSVRLAIWDP